MLFLPLRWDGCNGYRMSLLGFPFKRIQFLQPDSSLYHFGNRNSILLDGLPRQHGKQKAILLRIRNLLPVKSDFWSSPGLHTVGRSPGSGTLVRRYGGQKTVLGHGDQVDGRMPLSCSSLFWQGDSDSDSFQCFHIHVLPHSDSHALEKLWR